MAMKPVLKTFAGATLFAVASFIVGCLAAWAAIAVSAVRWDDD